MLFPRVLLPRVGPGMDRTGHFRRTSQSVQQSVDSTPFVAHRVLRRDPVSHLLRRPKPSVDTSLDTSCWASSLSTVAGLCLPSCVRAPRPIHPVYTIAPTLTLFDNEHQLLRPLNRSATRISTATVREVESGAQHPVRLDRLPSMSPVYPGDANLPRTVCPACSALQRLYTWCKVGRTANIG